MADFNVPDTVCVGEVVEFFDASSGGNLFSWDFGNGLVSTQKDPTTIYTSPGTYTVTLSIDAGPGCDDVVTKQIYVEEVIADFISSPNYGCEIPHLVNYTDNSTGNIVHWEYHFGELIGLPPYQSPNISNQSNPDNVFTSTGSFDDTLIVTSSAGCKDTIIKVANVEIFVVDVSIGANHKEGCNPLTVNFNDASTPQDSIQSVLWDFGDPNNTTSSLSNPQFTYVDTGVYVVQLTVLTKSGCTHSVVDTVKVGLKQTANFQLLTNIACASDTVEILNLSTDTNLITSYAWDFGDGTTSEQFEPLQSFKDTGWLDVTLVVSHNGCKDTLTQDSAIYINGPVLDFQNTILDCQNPYLMNFISTMKGVTNFEWDFGDGSNLDSTNIHPTHLYDTTGMYYVGLYAENLLTGCTNYVEHPVFVRDVKAVLSSPDTFFCAPFDVRLYGNNSVDAVFYHWDFGGGAPNGAPINSYEEATFDTSGYYTVTLVAQDQYQCKDTTSIKVSGYMNHADFSAVPQFGCVPLGVQFTDLTQADTTLISWAYSFGDGNMGYSQNPFHSYSIPGSHQYTVVLTVFDVLGCTSDIIYDPLIETSQPDVNFTASDVFLCEGEPTDFISLINTNGYTYHWDFGDGNTSSLVNPTHSYTSEGIYDVSLTITNLDGCDSTFTRISYIDVQGFPKPMLTANPSDTTCYPAPVTIIDTGAYGNGFYWSWNFGDDTNFVTTGGRTAQHIYKYPGSYDVTVIVETTYGCIDTIVLDDFINIGGPIANLVISPDTACFLADVIFRVDSASGIYEYKWDFGDGVIEKYVSSN